MVDKLTFVCYNKLVLKRNLAFRYENKRVASALPDDYYPPKVNFP